MAGLSQYFYMYSNNEYARCCLMASLSLLLETDGAHCN